MTTTTCREVFQLYELSHLELHYALVVFGGELGVLEEGVFHVDQVPLVCREAIQDERYLGKHRRLQGELRQRGRGALDGCSVLTIHTALEETGGWEPDKTNRKISRLGKQNIKCDCSHVHR